MQIENIVLADMMIIVSWIEHQSMQRYLQKQDATVRNKEKVT